MTGSVLRGAVAVAMLMLPAAPAAAQQFSDSYQFLQAVREAEGAKVTEILNTPGSRIIDTRDRRSGDGALHIVTRRSDSTYLRFLLQKDANPNLQDSEGNSPLLLATNQRWADGMRILIAYHADVNLANARGETPLIRAVQLRDLQLARMLLDAGADPDKTDLLAGMSARDYALADTRSPAIRRLLEEAERVERGAITGPSLR